MKYIFFINPMAGQGKGIKSLGNSIRNVADEMGIDCEIYFTKSVGDGEAAARRFAEALTAEGECGRFYGCGGDGTNNEIINGTYGFDNIEVGCVPIGTGNDMVRNFPDAGDFMDIGCQISGESRPIDLIQYSGIINGVQQKKYCVNMFNIGFDCNVVELAARLKSKPMVAGSMAYLLAVAGMFAKKKGINLKLIDEGKVLVDGQVLLCSIANGSYCGGGIYSSPQASLCDGCFDVNIVKDVTRFQFIKLFPKYKKGTHLQVDDISEILTIKRCKTLTLVPREQNFFICTDGEIQLAEQIDFAIVPGGIRFIVPARK